MVTILAYDCGCSPGRHSGCRTYATRWKVYHTISKEGFHLKILLKCRDCGRLRHYLLLNNQQPCMIQYTGKENDEEELYE